MRAFQDIKSIRLVAIAAVLGLAPTIGLAAGLTLQDRLQEELAAFPVPLAPAVIQAVQSHTVVFVEGLFNEAHSGTAWNDPETNFGASMQTLATEFLMTDFVKLAPPSYRSIAVNADWPRDELPLIYRSHGGHPLLIVAYSKGGAESLLMCLQHPDFLTSGMIDQLVVVQGAIGGSPLATLGGALGNSLAAHWAGLQSLRPADIQGLFREALTALGQNQTPTDLEWLNHHTFYIRGSQRPPNVIRMLVPTNLYLQLVAGDNDGALAVGDQRLAGFGQDLGVLDADHEDLVSAPAVVSTSVDYKRAFTRAMFRTILE